MTDLLPCPFCGGEVRIVLLKDEFDCYWWTVARGADDETACHCRVFMECDRRWQVNEGDEPEDYPLASALKRWLIEKWNTRTPENIAATLKGELDSMPFCEQVDKWLHGGAPSECLGCDEGKYAELKAATLGSGECKITMSATDGLCSDDPKVYYELSCGHRMMLYGLDVPIRCAVCGKAVKR